jgi:ATP-dependent helicase/nuclease subunit A
MAAYQAALAVIFPGRRSRGGFALYRRAALIRLDEAVLAAHKPGLAGTKANLGS